jgi:hypothetical protein
MHLENFWRKCDDSWEILLILMLFYKTEMISVITDTVSMLGIRIFFFLKPQMNDGNELIRQEDA